MPHLPRLVTMVAKFFLHEGNENNSMYYFLVILFLFIVFLSTTKVNNAKC